MFNSIISLPIFVLKFSKLRPKDTSICNTKKKKLRTRITFSFYPAMDKFVIKSQTSQRQLWKTTAVDWFRVRQYSLETFVSWDKGLLFCDALDHKKNSKWIFLAAHAISAPPFHKISFYL